MSILRHKEATVWFDSIYTVTDTTSFIMASRPMGSSIEDFWHSFNSCTAFRRVQISLGETKSRHKPWSRKQNWSFGFRFSQNCIFSTKNWCQNFEMYHLTAKKSILAELKRTLLEQLAAARRSAAKSKQ